MPGRRVGRYLEAAGARTRIGGSMASPRGTGRSDRGQTAARAKPGGLSENAAYVLELLHLFHRRRLRGLRDLLGRGLHLSEARGLLLRLVLLEYAAGHPLTVTRAQKRLAEVASKNAVRAEARLLAELGVVVLERAGGGRGSQTTIWPTEQTVRWYDRQLAADAHLLLRLADQLRAELAS